MEILNIDAFAKVTRQISLGGVVHSVEEPSVQDFIDNLKAAEALELAGDKDSVSKNFEQAIAAISQAIPTLDVSAVRSLKLPAMTAILQFIRGELPASASPQTQGALNDAGAEKKPS